MIFFLGFSHYHSLCCCYPEAISSQRTQSSILKLAEANCKDTMQHAVKLLKSCESQWNLRNSRMCQVVYSLFSLLVCCLHCVFLTCTRTAHNMYWHFCAVSSTGFRQPVACPEARRHFSPYPGERYCSPSGNTWICATEIGRAYLNSPGLSLNGVRI